MSLRIEHAQDDSRMNVYVHSWEDYGTMLMHTSVANSMEEVRVY